MMSAKGLIFDAELKAAQAFWLSRLPREASDSGLPLDFKRSTVHSPKPGSLRIDLAADTRRRLAELTRGSPLLTYTTLLAALQVTLRRYTGADTIVVGSPAAKVAGEAEPNVLAIATELRDELPFRSLLQDLRKALVAAYEHQRYPFHRLVEELGIAPSLHRCPLFDVVASLDGFHGALPALTHDATFLFAGAAEALSLEVRFNARLLHRDTVAAFTASYARLLGAALENPASPIADLSIVPVDDERAIVGEGNLAKGSAEGPGVLALLEAQVDRTPDAVAVEHERAGLTYRELDERANRLAHLLRSEGAGPGVAVGICAAPGLDLHVGLLAILRSGAAYLPLDPAYPRDRLAFMIDDARPRLVLAEEAARERLPGGHARVIGLEECRDLSATHPATRLAAPDAGDLAYILFTSGSTGRPKGVCMAHGALANLIEWQLRQSRLPEGARTLQRTSVGFDVSFQEIFATWCAGGTLVVAPDDVRNDLFRLPQFLAEHRVARAFLPFVALQQLARAMAVQQRFPASLREIVTAGEQLRVTPPIMDVFRQIEGCSLVNQYGPTETHVVTSFALDGPAIRWPALPPIGRPIDGASVYLLDSRMRPVPDRAVGEIYVGGAALARGYLTRPALTAERFVPSPFGADRGARLYRTGDLARRRRDGEIEFLGRIDRQVKIRGHRVELGEVEATLSQHPEIGEAVAMGRADDAGETRLVAWVVPAYGHHPGGAELRRFLDDKLPPAMIPAIFVRLDALPLTSTGKVDLGALPPPDWARPEEGGRLEPARTPTERLLARIWSEVLGLERVGVSDNFLALGGDSILATQVVARASQAGLGIRLRDVFQHQTIGELALVAAAAEAPLVAEDLPGPAPLTAIQRWLLEQPLPRPSHWNMGVLLETREALDPRALEQATQALAFHHDALRLRFVRDGVGFSQVAGEASSRSSSSAFIDLSVLPPEEQPRAIAERAAELQAKLDIEAGPLVLVALFDLGAGRPGRLLFTAHHLVMDGVSLRIIVADLEAAYRQVMRGEDIALPPRTASFTTWARLASEHARSVRARDELGFWLRQAEPPPVALPLDEREGRNTEASAVSLHVTLDADETRALLEVVPVVHGAAIQDALLTALALALSRWTGAPSVLVDVEGHGREEIVPGASFARTVGWFTSLFPVRLDVGGARSPAEALQAVRAQLERIPNHGIGHGILRYLADPEVRSALAALPRPEVSFNYLGQFDPVLASSSLFGLAAESAGPMVDPRGERSHRLYVGGLVVGGQLRIELRYSAEVHRAATIVALADSFLGALRAIVASPAAGREPARFTQANVSPADLAAVLAALGGPSGDRE